MKRIEKLTPEQESLLPVYLEKWRAIGLSTERVDWKTADGVVAQAYQNIGLATPITLHFQSPYQAACGWVILYSLLGQLSDQLSGPLSGPLSGQLRDQLSGPLSDQLLDQLLDQLSGPLLGQLRDQLSDPLLGQLSGPLLGQLSGQLSDPLRDLLLGQLEYILWLETWGQFEAWWFSRFDFAETVLGIDLNPRWHDLKAICQAVGWAFLWPRFAFLIDRPTHIEFDARQRLHSATRAAVEYSDGWSYYAVHGVRVPGDIIENPNGLTARRIQVERNAEVRRIMLDLFTPERYLVESGAAEVARDAWGVLYRADLPGDEPLVMVRYRDASTEREYFHRVHPELRPIRKFPDGRQELGSPQALTPLNAIASTFGRRGEEYHPQLQS